MLLFGRMIFFLIWISRTIGSNWFWRHVSRKVWNNAFVLTTGIAIGSSE